MSDSAVSPSLFIIHSIPVGSIRPSPHQIRKDFDAASIQRLAESIDKEGLIQPITVRRVGEGFELIAGERRYRAVQFLGRPTIEARIIEVPSEAAASAKGLVENLQREDLNPMEEAEGFSALNQMDPAYWTHERIAAVAGKDRTYITKSLGFLGLPPELKSDRVLRSTFARNHLIQLCRLSDPLAQSEVAKSVKNGLNVEETRRLVDQWLEKLKGQSGPTARTTAARDPLAAVWPSVMRNRHVQAMGGWAVHYKQDHWNFSVSHAAIQTKTQLAQWFRQMAEVLTQEADVPEEDAQVPSRIHEPQDLMPSTSEELELMVKEQRRMRLPQTEAEEAELASLVDKGPRAVYAWIYGETSVLAQKVGSSTWTDFGIQNPKEGFCQLLDGMRKIQNGDLS